MDNKVTLKYFEEKIASRKDIYYDESYASELLFKSRSLSLEVNIVEHTDFQRQRIKNA